MAAIQPKNTTGIKVDTVDEKTASTGVTIENVLIKDSAVNFMGTTTGSSNTYAASAPTISAYVTGMRFVGVANHSNTGTATLNINTVGAITIKRQDGNNLSADDIPSGSVIDVVYDGTNFILMTPKAPVDYSLSGGESAFTSGTGSFSSGSYATMSGMTETVTVGANDWVLIMWDAQVAYTKTDSTWFYDIQENGTSIKELGVQDGAFTAGDNVIHSGHRLLTSPTTGSVTYDLKWKRDSGTGAVSATDRSFTVLVLTNAGA